MFKKSRFEWYLLLYGVRPKKSSGIQKMKRALLSKARGHAFVQFLLLLLRKCISFYTQFPINFVHYIVTKETTMHEMFVLYFTKGYKPCLSRFWLCFGFLLAKNVQELRNKRFLIQMMSQNRTVLVSLLILIIKNMKKLAASHTE